MEKIPVFAPTIGEDTKKHLSEAIDVGWLGMGSASKEFEERISEFLNLKKKLVPHYKSLLMFQSQVIQFD